MFASRYRVLISALLAVLFVSGVTFGYAAYRAHQHQEMLRQEQIKKEHAIAQQRREVLDAFGVIVNDLVKTLAKQAGAYRKKRIILFHSVEPINFETPDYAKESYQMFLQSVVPSLRASADEMISTFARADKKAEEALTRMPEDMRDDLRQKWKNMTRAKMDAYISFFEKEDKLIEAHRDLIKFYVTHSQHFTISDDLKTVVFDDQKDAKREKELKNAIKLLQ